VAAKLNLPQNRGVVVTDVLKGSPSDASGVATGDVILSADGVIIATARQLQQKVIDKRPGDKLTLSILRMGKKIECIVYMGKFPEQPNEDPIKKGGRVLGLYVTDIDEEISLQYEITDNHGVVIARLDPGQPAEMSGLEIGDLVKEVDGKPVPNIASFSHVIDQMRGRNSVQFLIKRHSVQKFVTVYLR
jgi:serine protease Do